MGLNIENMMAGTVVVCMKGPTWREPIGPMHDQTHEREDTSLHGWVLEILAVSPPFFMGSCLWPKPGARLMLDTRRYQVTAASQPLVDAIKKACAQHGQPIVQFVPQSNTPSEGGT